MARTQRPPINMDRQVTLRMVEETFTNLREDENFQAVWDKLRMLMKLHKLKVNKGRGSQWNVPRLIQFYHNNPDKLPTARELQPYETFTKRCYSNVPPLEIIDLTNDE